VVVVAVVHAHAVEVEVVVVDPVEGVSPSTRTSILTTVVMTAPVEVVALVEVEVATETAAVVHLASIIAEKDLDADVLSLLVAKTHSSSAQTQVAAVAESADAENIIIY
jgi:hypothetical protein